MVISSNSSTS